MSSLPKILTFFIVIASISPSPGQDNTQVQPFAPEVMLQFPNVRDLAMSSDGGEAYFSAQSPMGDHSVIMKTEKTDGAWTKPTIVHFSGKFMDLEPFLTWDGKRLYFASNRPLSSEENKAKDFDIWYVERDNAKSAWSAPANCSSPVNSEHNEFYPSLSRSGNLYFTSDPPDSKGKDDIYFCEWDGKSFRAPVSLGESINTEGYEFNAFIAPDESYLIYTGYNRDDGLGSGDLYISYRNEDGLWSNSVNFGKTINSDKMDYCPFVHAPTNTLFFTSRRIHLVPPEEGFRSTDDFLTFINGYQNGLSRIYLVKFDPGRYH